MEIINGKKKGWRLFSEIKNLKGNCLKKSQIARYLGVDYKTVSKYFNMTPDEFSDLNRKRKKKKLDIYKDQILEWFSTYPDLSSAQITDWIKERYGNVPCSERSVRAYISSLRSEYKIPKQGHKRQYEAVEELEMGFQAQVYFGQIWVDTIDGSRIKLLPHGHGSFIPTFIINHPFILVHKHIIKPLKLKNQGNYCKLWIH
ncbi:hypothetical protein [Caloramator proteoclasticus]|uniref:HTH IS21-type domain-containing protein n=1 Tax=Caloramator proteoclasticus DSM 10124 TaxID=1121262 RepID=A0A1M4ZAL1_9CLOT|nr:hypothetical protein [Caloramator proteoclasticus]SHF15080.1 hypothetical protein SAMN02746091_01877 [Caloramator proteoclasticus DSM 10124]